MGIKNHEEVIAQRKGQLPGLKWGKAFIWRKVSCDLSVRICSSHKRKNTIIK